MCARHISFWLVNGVVYGPCPSVGQVGVLHATGVVRGVYIVVRVMCACVCVCFFTHLAWSFYRMSFIPAAYAIR